MAKEGAPFGPPGDEWTYAPDTMTYNLCRGADSKATPAFNLGTSRGPPGTSVTIDPQVSALVVIDMQNYFLHPSCNDHVTGREAAARTVEVVSKCREAGIRIIWLNWGLTEADLSSMPAAIKNGFAGNFTNPSPPAQRRQRGLGVDLGDDKGRCLMRASWNAQLYDPLLAVCRPDEDLQCAKSRVSGLWDSQTPLALALREHGVRTLLFAGVNTNQCVMGTLWDACHRGWDCVLVEDCCATMTPGGQDVSVLDAFRGCGFVVDSQGISNGQLIR